MPNPPPTPQPYSPPAAHAFPHSAPYVPPTPPPPRAPAGPTHGAARTPAATPRGSIRDQRQCTNTLHLNPDHRQKFETSGKSIRELKEHSKCPQKGHGQGPICLSFFLRGNCYDNCGSIRESPPGSGQSLDGHAMNADEQRRFDAFVNEVVVAPR